MCVCCMAFKVLFFFSVDQAVKWKLNKYAYAYNNVSIYVCSKMETYKNNSNKNE